MESSLPVLSIADREVALRIASELANAVSADAISNDAAQLTQWSMDDIAPRCVVSPGSAAEVAELLKLCSARGWVVVPAGGFTMQSTGRRAAACDVLLRTDRLNHVAFYDPGDLTVGLGAGVTIAAQRALLREHGQWLPLSGASSAKSTIGGVAATNFNGPAAACFGGLREYCIGVQFVTSDGKTVRGGGRVVKNVAGYDLMKLMIGSFGTLGVITEMNFKVFPRPRQTRTFLLECASPEELMATRDRLLRTSLTPLCFEIISPHAQELLQHPAEARDPDEYAPEGRLDSAQRPWVLAMRASGSDAVLARYRSVLRKGTPELAEAAEEEFWERLDNFASYVAARGPNSLLLRIGSTTDQVAAVLSAVAKMLSDFDLLPAVIGRAAMASFLVGLVPLAVGPPSAEKLAKAIAAVRAAVPAGAIVTVLGMPAEAKTHCDPWDAHASDLDLMRNIKRALDPAGILNRGRYMV